MEAGGGYEGCDSRFVQFCQHGPIKALSSAKHIIVKTKKQPHNSIKSHVIYTSNPLIYLTGNYLQRSLRLSILFRHLLLTPLYYIKALINSPLNVLLSRDLSILPICSFLDKKKLIEAIIITTSSFTSQPLWMKGLTDQKFKLHMIWYSQNFIPKMYLGEQEAAHLPPARRMEVDVHWVWTEGFKSYLRQLGQTSEIQVVGPILWYLPDQITEFDDTFIKIALFDVTPLPDGKTAHGIARNYYSVTTMKKLITDILETCDEITALTGQKVLVLLKHKRAPKSGYHNSLYIEFIDQLLRLRPNFKLIDHQINLFGLLEKCHLSISIPYTSTAYVAAAVKKPTIFYDPFAELVPRHEKNEWVHFAGGPTDLKQLVGRLLKNPQPLLPHFVNTEASAHEQH